MNKPMTITSPEWAEIMQVTEVREGWGLDDDMTPDDFIPVVCGVKFDFMSGGPGYCGDLYILLGDGLEAPLVLIRQGGILVADRWASRIEEQN